MRRSFRVGTLALALPIGRTILAAAAILLAAVGACEAVARSGVARPYLPTPMVSGHAVIGSKLDLLARIEGRDGPVDCFFIGSSMVLREIDPEVVAQAYLDRTGQRITCFNFGLAGLNVTGAARLAQILIARYHPRLLVYGTSFRDYVGKSGSTLDIPWASYQLGQPSLEGWLETESVSYRYLLAYDYHGKLRIGNRSAEVYSDYGYSPMNGVMDVSSPASRESMPDAAEAWVDYNLSPRRVSDLRKLLSVNETGTSLVVVEMPVPETLFGILSHGKQDYQKFTDRMTTETRARNIPFWLTLEDRLIPPDGWHDYVHMNRTGATVFSQWLGQQLAEAARQGLILNQAP